MLDEILENKQYTAPYDKCEYRLAFENLKDGMTGVKRALEIRARDLLFAPEKPDIESVKKELTNWLHQWLSFEYIEGSATNKRTGEIKKGTDQVKKDLMGFRSRFAKDIVYDAEDLGNDFNEVTYERVIAAALERGPLIKYCMVSKNNRLAENEIIKESKRSTNKVTLSKAEADYLLKLTAAFLLENKLHQESVKLTEANVTNWCISPSTKKVIYKFKESKDGKQEEIFVKNHVTSGDNLAKICFKHRWIDDFCLIDITEDGSLESWQMEHPNWYCYIDQGSGKPLNVFKI